MLPWTVLFRGFQVAIDPRKLLLAAAGILVMMAGWQMLTWIFGPGTKPELAKYQLDKYVAKVTDKEATERAGSSDPSKIENGQEGTGRRTAPERFPGR